MEESLPASLTKPPDPWEEPRAPRHPRANRLFRWGLTAPDVARNPRLWPFRWIYGDAALDRLRRVASGSRRILDVRCGSGWLLWELAKVAPQARLIGLDSRPQPVAWGKLQSELRLGAAMGQIELVEADFLEWEGEEGEFDLIVCNLALSQTEQADLWLEKIQRLLKPGGTVYYYEGTEPTNLTTDRLARYYFRRRRWRGVQSDLWNLRREVRASFSQDSLRSWRHPKAVPEVELFGAFQGLFEVMEQGRLRALTDLWLRSLPARWRIVWLPFLLFVDQLAIKLGWLDGARRYAFGRKPR